MSDAPFAAGTRMVNKDGAKARIILAGKCEDGKQRYCLRFSSNLIGRSVMTRRQLEDSGWSMVAGKEQNEED